MALPLLLKMRGKFHLSPARAWQATFRKLEQTLLVQRSLNQGYENYGRVPMLPCYLTRQHLNILGSKLRIAVRCSETIASLLAESTTD